MGSVLTSKASLFARPCAAFVEGVLTGIFIGMVVALALATPVARAESAKPSSPYNPANPQSLKTIVAQSDQRLPSYDCQQARRNYEGAAASANATSRELDSRKSAMKVVCNFTPPGRGINSLNNMQLIDVMPNHRNCKDDRDLNCFRNNLKY